MRIMLVHPGASVSTADVHIGLAGGLKACGHDVYEYALDARIERAAGWLTYCWRKGGKAFDRPNQSDILYMAGEELVARALRVQPDVVLVVSAMYLHPDVFVLMHRAQLRVAVLFTESPYDDDRQVRLMPWIDLAWTNERTSAQRMGAKYLPHAWNPDRHGFAGEVDETVPAHDVVFVGTGFSERIETLSAIDFQGLDFGLYGSWDLLGSRNVLRQYLRGGYVDNVRATMLYRRAKIGLNLYRTSMGFASDAPRITSAESLNPRAYELAAAGCFTISDARLEVEEVFGALVPTFTRPEDVRPLLDIWLAADRSAVQALLPASVAQHTWHARAMQAETDLYGAGIVARHIQREPASALSRTAVGG